MCPEHALLWQKLESLDLDGDASLPFSKRLARDNGWSHDFAVRVVGEYKRFLFLAATCGHPVTPSDEVDQAWHLHLVYTRSYWDELCGEILGFPFHHGPTRGGAKEGAKFENWYEKTCASYRAAFGADAPCDVWPDASVRFGHATSFRRVNLKREWVIRKPFGGDISMSRKRGAALVPVWLFLFLAGCAEAQNVGPNVFNWGGEPFLQFFWTLSAVVLSLGWWLRNNSLEPRDRVFPMERLDAYEVARLRDGKTLAADVALAALWEKGALEIVGDGTLRAAPTSAWLHPFEQAVLNRLSGVATWGQTSVQRARRELEAHAPAIDDKLRSLGLLLSRDAQERANLWLLGGTLGLMFLGAVKIIVGLSRDRPVGFLAVSCALLLAFFLFVAFNPARRSRRGDALLQFLLAQRHLLAPRSFRQYQPPGYEAGTRNGEDYEALAFRFALVGFAAFPIEMQHTLRPPSGGGDSGSDGGGDGGSGGDGDGGGGGCGGCGGGGD